MPEEVAVSSIYAVNGEFCRRLTTAAACVATSTILWTHPQVVNLSMGKLPRPTISSHIGVFSRLIVGQTVLKALQYVGLVELARLFDRLSPQTKALNTMVSYGATGSVLQTILYNRITSAVYRHYGVTRDSSSSFLTVIKKRIYPGFFWSFTRECCGAGGGLVLGPIIQNKLRSNKTTEQYVTTHPSATRFFTGLIGGISTAVATQWMHNTCLKAGAMAELGNRVPTTLECLQTAIRDHGYSLLYRNAPKRVGAVSVAVAFVSWADIVKR
eukprot:TRINITY_DN55716_c0_g2_i1.p1 TRINITY_DN55716_c0_g2~~TRINITY_DN55716_c0_g2_i1.p1  ORF type:complete len:270 (-),score=7.04 TRINITY_DN55716_c0_g2_i1:760-1569(-)